MTPWIPQPDPVPLPGPPWLFTALLLLTFFLHLLVMNLVVGGTVIALASAFRARSSAMARSLALSLAKALPVGIAFTVTLGVAALLFLQVLYGRLFFASSVLMAAWWIAVIPLLLVGYYAAYGAADTAATKVAGLRLAIVATMLLAIAFIYTTNMTLMLQPGEFVARFRETARGTHGNLGDPTFFPRLAHTLLSALAVGGFGITLAGLVVRREHRARGGWMMRHGARWFVGATATNFLVGVVWLGTVPVGTAYALLGGEIVPALILGAGTLSGVAAVVLMMGTAFGDGGAARVGAATGSLVICIALMVLTRDFLRHAALSAAGFTPVTWTAPQWGPIAIFLLLLVAAIAIVAWMVWQLAKSSEAARPHETLAA